MLEVRRAQERFLTQAAGVRTWHCFSFGPHYDPAHVGHGRLVVHDEHLLEPGAGFGPHPHRDLEVVSWVLEGALVHEDAGGRRAVPAGVLQRMVTGGGVVHDERAGAVRTRFVQLWLTAEPGTPPSYEQVVVGPLAQVAPHVFAGELRGGWTVPDAERVHVYLAGGSCLLDGMALAPGDAVRLTGAGPLLLEAGEPAQVLVVSLPQA